MLLAVCLQLRSQGTPGLSVIAYYSGNGKDSGSSLYLSSPAAMVRYLRQYHVGALQTQYAIDNKLGGIMFWELGSDAYRNGLLHSIYQTKISYPAR